MKSREEIYSLTSVELSAKLGELNDEMENLLLQKATHQINNPLQIRKVRRDIARVRTLMTEFDRGIRVSRTEEKK